VSEQVLTYRDAYKSCDALAIAPYFGHSFGSPQRQNEVAAMPVERLMDEVAKEVAGENREVIRKQVETARRFKVELFAYEGGQHLVGHGGAENNETLTDRLIAANRHPRMYDLFTGRTSPPGSKPAAAFTSPSATSPSPVNGAPGAPRSTRANPSPRLPNTARCSTRSAPDWVFCLSFAHSSTTFGWF
jgi:hypothetical protein